MNKRGLQECNDIAFRRDISSPSSGSKNNGTSLLATDFMLIYLLAWLVHEVAKSYFRPHGVSFWASDILPSHHIKVSLIPKEFVKSQPLVWSETCRIWGSGLLSSIARLVCRARRFGETYRLLFQDWRVSQVRTELSGFLLYLLFNMRRRVPTKRRAVTRLHDVGPQNIFFFVSYVAIRRTSSHTRGSVSTDT
jgi:hypothetical protein